MHSSGLEERSVSDGIFKFRTFLHLSCACRIYWRNIPQYEYLDNDSSLTVASQVHPRSTIVSAKWKAVWRDYISFGWTGNGTIIWPLLELWTLWGTKDSRTLKFFNFYFHLCLFAYIYVCAPLRCLFSEEARRGHPIPWNWNPGCCEPPCSSEREP